MPPPERQGDLGDFSGGQATPAQSKNVLHSSGQSPALQQHPGAHGGEMEASPMAGQVPVGSVSEGDLDFRAVDVRPRAGALGLHGWPADGRMLVRKVPSGPPCTSFPVTSPLYPSHPAEEEAELLPDSHMVGMVETGLG